MTSSYSMTMKHQKDNFQNQLFNFVHSFLVSHRSALYYQIFYADTLCRDGGAKVVSQDTYISLPKKI